MDDIETLKKRIANDKKSIEELRFKEKNNKAAEQIHNLYQSFVDKGFSDEQAFYLLVEMVKTTWQK